MYHYLRTMSRKLVGFPAMLLALCMLMLTAPAASASAVPAPDTATGTVLDQTGEPLPGASVMVVGTTLGGSTDIDGNFSIAGVKQGATLRVSFVGCKPADVKWEGQHLNITLQDDGQTLDEVVVVGFGQQKKVNLTGAVSTVSSKELANRPVNSVVDALQGLVPGMDVLSSSLGGQLNGTKTMNIRGTGTIGTGSSVTPLTLIDGMEGDINTVNPADVENISILKDASASSIYGSRASGGVILITTKKGKEGKVTVNYSDSFRWSKVTRMPKMMDSYKWALYMNEGSVNSGQGTFITDEKFSQILAYQKDPTIQSMFENPGTGKWEFWDILSLLPIENNDWLDIHFGKTGFSQEHNLSVTGGTEKLNYSFSANYLDQGGILRYGDDNVNRYIVNGKVSAQLASWINFSYATRWYRNEYDGPAIVGNSASNQLYHDVLRYWPTIPVKDPNGHYTKFSNIPGLMEGGRYKDAEDRFDQQFLFRLNPVEGLNINAEVNYRTVHENVHRDNLMTYSYTVDDVPYEDPAASAPSNTQVYEYNIRSNYFNPNVYGDYSFDINEAHNFKVMAGFQSEWLNQKYYSASNSGIINNLPFLSTTDGEKPSVSGGADTWSTAGFFGRLNYDYKGRYLVEGNIRYDGSSRFRSGRRWSWSPSFSLGWNIAQEDFWKDWTNVCHTLKLRASWGKLGNQNTNSWYPTYSNMGYYATSNSWLINNARPTYATMPGLVASTLTWESNRTWDIGLDWGLLNNRLTGSFDYYQRKTMDMVGPGPSLPDVLGATVPNINSLDMTSKGWELTISWRDRIQDFTYGASFNLYDHNTYIDRYPNNPDKRLNIGDGFYGPYYEGAKLGDIWGYTTVGIAKTQEEMDAHLAKANQSAFGSGWTAGDIMYADLNGDGVVNNGENTLDNPGDRRVIGNNTPHYQFGLTLDAQWKGFDLKVFFQGTMKRDYWAGGTVFWGAVGNNQWQADVLEPHLDYFRNDPDHPLGLNLDSYYPRVDWGGGRNTSTQTRYLQNAAYCRLKNVTIGYTVPQNITRKAYIENLRVYFSGENLATITNFTKTGDPELIDTYRYAYGYGKVYPLSRVLSFGLNVTF